MSEKDGKDWYKVLGVAPSATVKEIKDAYRSMSRKYHPDKAKSEDEETEFTKMMYDINEAKEILLDQQKRNEYDRRRSSANQQPKTGKASDPGGAYKREDFRKKKKSKPQPTPGFLGRPYTGPRRPQSMFVDGNGKRGKDGDDGTPGADGYSFGRPGMEGGNATPAERGAAGDDLKINIQTVISEDHGYFEVEMYYRRHPQEVMDPTRPNHETVPLKTFEKLDWTAKGGQGGKGGVGGRGGNGHKGDAGRDATRFSRGTNGGDGGDGGAGGFGTNGADGGRGGDVEVILKRFDTYLLMRVSGCHENDLDKKLSGGVGGASGRHGRGGSGGAGGRGGSPYHYTTYETRYRTNSDGWTESYQVPIHNTVPGGYSGSRGRKGKTPQSRLYRGNDGKNGTFHIRVKEENGSEALYESCYDLVFLSKETKQLSDMKEQNTYEFGETVLIPSCEVKNRGRMETPNQRVMIRFGEVDGVNPNGEDRLFLRQNAAVPAGDKGVADEGFLRFTCPLPSTEQMGEDFDPIKEDASMMFTATQLGPENQSGSLLELSDFQEPYRAFQTSSEKLSMAFPVQNPDGVRGVRALAVRETTILEIKLNNISNHSFGVDSETERAVFLQLYYAEGNQYEIPIEDLRVRGDNGELVDINPALNPKGHRREVSFLPGGGDTTVRLSFKLNTDHARPSARAGLQVDLYLQKIPTMHPHGETTMPRNKNKRLIQRRLFEASCQPKFVEDDDGEVILVTTTASDADQVSAWQSLVGDRLGLKSTIYSLARYGHLCAYQEAEQHDLHEAFSGRLVVVLNEPYRPKPNDEVERRTECRPSELMKSAFDFHASTRFLIVGGQPTEVHHLSPNATGFNTVEGNNVSGDHTSSVSERESFRSSPGKPNRKTFREELKESFQSERTDGFSKERELPASQVITIKKLTLFKPTNEKVERMIARKAKVLNKWLERHDSLRRYHVKWHPHSEPDKVEKKALLTLWDVGEIVVYTGPPRFQDSIVLVGEERKSSSSTLSQERSIRTPKMLFAALNAAPFDMKIKSFCRSVQALTIEESESHEEVCDVVKDCLTSDFVWDISNYIDGQLTIEDPKERSPTLSQLMENKQLLELVEESLESNELLEVLRPHLSQLIACLRCVADSKDLKPWWNPFSRKRSVSKAMCESLGVLEHSWKHALDQEKIVSEKTDVEMKAKLHIKKERKKFFLRTRGRWRAALGVLHSPTNEEKYPRAPGMSSANIRIRRQCEFENGESTKMKPYRNEIISPRDSAKMSSELSQRLTFSGGIHRTTQSDRDALISL